MSLKLGQFEVVTADGHTAADVVTYTAQLIEDNDGTNDQLAQDLAAQVNNQQTIAAGIVPVGNIAYEADDTRTDPAIEKGRIELPENFELKGNYPNPFNPQTTIQFGMPESAHVSVVIYDALGRVVATLVDGVLDAGHHEVVFDAANLPTGTYLYQLETPVGVFSKTMILVK